MNLRGVFCLFCLCCAAAQKISAGGFSIYEASAKGNAMGGALLGGTDDASNAHYNPAAMTEVSGTALMSGATFLWPSATAEIKGQDYDLKSLTFVLPHAYSSTELLKDRLWFGFSMHVPYGTGTEYPMTMPAEARFYSTSTYMESIEVSPTLALKVTDDFSLAAGPRIIWTKTTIRQQLLLPYHYEGILKHQTEAVGYGFVVSGLYHITDKLDFGLVYRSQVPEDSSGTSYGWPTGAYDLDALVTLPDSWEGGLNYHVDKDWDIGFAAIYTGWSSYRRLTLKMPSNPMLQTISSYKSWDNVWRLCLGSSYQLSKRWSVMGGYVYDFSPISEEMGDLMMPVGDRQILSLGAGYQITDSISVLLSYSYLFMQTSRANSMMDNPGRPDPGSIRFHDCDAHMLGLSIDVTF